MGINVIELILEEDPLTEILKNEVIPPDPLLAMGECRHIEFRSNKIKPMILAEYLERSIFKYKVNIHGFYNEENNSIEFLIEYV